MRLHHCHALLILQRRVLSSRCSAVMELLQTLILYFTNTELVRHSITTCVHGLNCGTLGKRDTLKLQCENQSISSSGRCLRHKLLFLSAMPEFQAPMESLSGLSEAAEYKNTCFPFTFIILSTHCYSSVWGKGVAELSSLQHY